MPEETPVPKGHPILKAWEVYKSGEDYANTRKWALDPRHVDGSLWAAYAAGWEARHDIGRVQLLEQVSEAADALERFLGENAGCSAEWPVDLHCRDEESANKLTQLLADLQMRLKPLR